MQDLYIALVIIGVGGISVAGAFLLAYKNGQAAQKLAEVERENKIKTAQLAEAAKPLTPVSTVRERMREGKL